MITEKDIKHLRKLEKPVNVFLLRWIMPLLLVILIAIGIGNILLAKKFASHDGLSFTSFIQSWMNGVQINETYSGQYLMALERWGTALLEMSLAVLLVFIWLSSRVEIRRNKRILQFIESHIEQQP